jgi:hypothetical protein
MKITNESIYKVLEKLGYELYSYPPDIAVMKDGRPSFYGSEEETWDWLRKNNLITY